MPTRMQILAANWRTTTAGVIAAVIAVLDAVVKTVDGNPATVPDYALVVALVSTAIGLVWARDTTVTSKQLGLDDADSP